MKKAYKNENAALNVPKDAIAEGNSKAFQRMVS